MSPTVGRHTCDCGAPEGTNVFHDRACPITRLRAEAPAMLEALRAVLRADDMSNARVGGTCTETRLAWEQAMSEVRALIARLEAPK